MKYLGFQLPRWEEQDMGFLKLWLFALLPFALLLFGSLLVAFAMGFIFVACSSLFPMASNSPML